MMKNVFLRINGHCVREFISYSSSDTIIKLYQLGCFEFDSQIFKYEGIATILVIIHNDGEKSLLFY